MNRATDRERREREATALELLSSGAGSAFTAQTLAERYGVSLRQARRYVAVAALELCEPATPLELDRQAMLSLYRLDLIAGRAMAAGDEATAIRATRAHSAALAQFRRAITAPSVRFRLPDTRAAPLSRQDPAPECPF
jgi:predicted DNA-binding transcriptional regulator YafY